MRCHLRFEVALTDIFLSAPSRPMRSDHSMLRCMGGPPHKASSTPPRRLVTDRAITPRSDCRSRSCSGGQSSSHTAAGTGEHAGVRVHIVLLLRRPALNIENDVLA